MLRLEGARSVTVYGSYMDTIWIFSVLKIDHFRNFMDQAPLKGVIVCKIFIPLMVDFF